MLYNFMVLYVLKALYLRGGESRGYIGGKGRDVFYTFVALDLSV